MGGFANRKGPCTVIESEQVPGGQGRQQAAVTPCCVATALQGRGRGREWMNGQGVSWEKNFLSGNDLPRACPRPVHIFNL